MLYHLKTRRCVNTVHILNTVNTLCSFIKSPEKGLITKEGIRSNAYAFTNCFKWALHFSTLVITCFDSSTKLFQAVINTATL